ncbi:hypothetical protein FRC10_008544 [Ceratobasidium sp. 414]|nr:hypothetical protein FRC10_008544 [Ceratobasidium sp. 414]
MFSFKTISFVALLAALTSVHAQSGSGVTTRYWYAIPFSARRFIPVISSIVGTAAKRAVAGPAKPSPWAATDNLAYGFAAVKLQGGNEWSWCCQCYQLTFTSGPVAGKQMIVQATNTGAELGNNHFDIMIPGGGMGVFTQGCAAQYGDTSGWGARFGGVSSKSQCSQLPAALQAGCYWRFDWFKGADNPSLYNMY